MLFELHASGTLCPFCWSYSIDNAIISICDVICIGNGFAYAEYDDGGYERNRGYARGGRGRGRGRGFRGRGRGGFNGPQVDAQYDAGGYNQEAPRGTSIIWLFS